MSGLVMRERGKTGDFDKEFYFGDAIMDSGTLSLFDFRDPWGAMPRQPNNGVLIGTRSKEQYNAQEGNGPIALTSMSYNPDEKAVAFATGQESLGLPRFCTQPGFKNLLYVFWISGNFSQHTGRFYNYFFNDRRVHEGMSNNGSISVAINYAENLVDVASVEVMSNRTGPGINIGTAFGYKVNDGFKHQVALERFVDATNANWGVRVYFDGALFYQSEMQGITSEFAASDPLFDRAVFGRVNDPNITGNNGFAGYL